MTENSDKEDKEHQYQYRQDWKACAEKDTIRFVFTGDTQRWYDETEISKHVNQLDSDDFVIHGGDLTNFGIKKNISATWDPVPF